MAKWVKVQDVHGKSAKDVYIPVPLGTIVKDIDADKIIADMSEEGQELLLVKGGRGGRGNQHFAIISCEVLFIFKI
jgi:GTP-binding protein